MTPAQMVVLAGPSGAGKSRLAARLGLPVLHLDDFYKSGEDPSLPRIATGANAGIIDWDHPSSWSHAEAMAAVRELCHSGRVDVPIYEITLNGRTGTRTIELGAHTRFVAEGIFAPEIVSESRRDGLLAAAYCITQHPLLTFWRRLTRDLRERRKPPLLLLRRGLDLLRGQRQVVARAVRSGCQPATADEAYAELNGTR